MAAARAEVAAFGRRAGPREVASLGILLGCVAFLLALPLGKTIPTREPLWPAIVGVLAVAAGIWAVTRGTRRLGWLAVAAGLVGIALGVTGYFYIEEYGANGTPGSVSQIPDVNIPGAGHLGIVGNVLGHLNLMIWLAFVLLIVSYFVLFRTPIGLRIRSVGEHPRAADTVGISVYGLRYAAVILSGMLA